MAISACLTLPVCVGVCVSVCGGECMCVCVGLNTDVIRCAGSGREKAIDSQVLRKGLRKEGKQDVVCP